MSKKNDKYQTTQLIRAVRAINNGDLKGVGVDVAAAGYLTFDGVSAGVIPLSSIMEVFWKAGHGLSKTTAADIKAITESAKDARSLLDWPTTEKDSIHQIVKNEAGFGKVNE
ncbi:hypothetical protein FRB95_011901 [Tulasnella sp. JGI-2019a]|nr:hypothetical protein FRB95_011901 [Tulasnella sp. JGI-2019a]